MKNIFLILITLPLFAFSQQVKHNSKKIKNIQIQQELILANLEAHHKQYKLGFIMQISGGLISSIVLSNKNNSDDNLSIISSVVALIGGIIVIDSDKWFSKKWINGNYTHKENLRLEDEGGYRFVPNVNSRESITPKNTSLQEIEVQPLENNNIKNSVINPKTLYYLYKGKRCEIVFNISESDLVQIKFLSGSSYLKKVVSIKELTLIN